MEKGEQKYLLEVKGCTLEVDGIGYFPDAPTERGVKHLHELAQAQRTGYQCAVAFVIQMEGITEVRPNVRTQSEFGTALAEAKAAGVQVLFLLCHVGRDSLEIVEQREGWRRKKNALRDSVTEIINRKCYHIDTRNTPITFRWRISI